MSAQIINLQAWRVAHSERPALCLELIAKVSGRPHHETEKE